MKGRKLKRALGMQIIVVMNYISQEAIELLAQVDQGNISESLSESITECSDQFLELERGIANRYLKIDEYESIEQEVFQAVNGEQDGLNNALELLEYSGSRLDSIPMETIGGMQMIQLSKYAKGSIMV